jgi:hypothetical protein
MAEMNKVDASQRLDTLDARGNWVYPSAAESGHVELELPALPGSTNAVERLHVRDFGVHVAAKVESSMKQNPYLKSGPQQGPAQVLKHYLAVAKGASLMDEGALKRMETLAQDFEREPEQEEFFKQLIRPYLHGLKPGKR